MTTTTQPKKQPFKIKETTTREYSGGEINDSNADKVIQAAYGAKMPGYQKGGQMLQEGGMAMGPSHEEGGIPVAQEDTGEQVAEIEGGERVFSIEDTQMMEQAAMAIIEAMEAGDQATAEDMAKRLGFAVVQMIGQQEANMANQAPAAAQDEQMAMEAANQFGTEPETMETI
jgi:hypothetical protein